MKVLQALRGPFVIRILFMPFVGLMFSNAVFAKLPQTPATPRLIHRFPFPPDPNNAVTNELRYTVLEMVNVGDRGSVDMTTTPPTTTTAKDGFDDFAVLFHNKVQPTTLVHHDAKIWVYDGRKGQRLRDAYGVLIEYFFPESEVNVAWGGLSADGGKDLTGDAWPDLVVGAPGAKDSLGNTIGALYILNMKDPSSTAIQRIDAPDPLVDRFFGHSVAILGDFRNGPKAELLVGAPQTQFGSSGATRGRVYVLDLDSLNPVVATIDAPFMGTNNGNTDYGFDVATLGPLMSKDSVPQDIWDGLVDRTPEFVVSDPLATFYIPYPYPPTWLSFAGLVGVYNAFGLDSTPAVSTVPLGLHYTGTNSNEQLGFFVAGLGDVDLAYPSSTTSSRSWDCQVANFNGEFGFFTDPNPINAALPIVAYQSTTGWILHPSLGVVGINEGNEPADQMASVGDLDLDQVTNGMAELSWVEFTGGALGVPVSHQVRVVSYNPGAPGSATNLYVIDKDPTTLSPLVGNAATISSGTTQAFGGVTSVSRLGDVDGDGIDDFGVVSGYGSSGNETGLAMVFGSHIGGQTFTTGTVGGGAATVRLLGNRWAQRGSRIAITVTGCRPLASGVLYEDVTLQTPGIPMCGGFRRVTGTAHPFTCDTKGEYTYLRDLNYYTTTASDLPGTVWYYQAVVNPPPNPCTLTGIRAVLITESSSALDSYPGDS